MYYLMALLVNLFYVIFYFQIVKLKTTTLTQYLQPNEIQKSEHDYFYLAVKCYHRMNL